MHDTLEKIDIIRQRTGVSYQRAREVLDACGGDVVEALVRLENEDRTHTWQETIQAQGGELVDKVKRLIQEGNVNRLVVKNNGDTLFEVPVTVGAIGALLLPTAAALGVVAAMVTRCSLIVERRHAGPDASVVKDTLEPDADAGDGWPRP
ncbi:MAG: DUF4342 domain-containing protein [Thermaerobacterales bacterium]